MNEPLPRGAVEQLDRRELHVGGGAGRLSLSERGTERGTLRAIAGLRGARLPHVLLRGCDVRHELDLQKIPGKLRYNEARNLGMPITDVKAGQCFDSLSDLG